MATPAAPAAPDAGIVRAGLWLLLTLLGSLTLLGLASQHTPHGWQPDPPLTLQLGDQRYQLDHERLSTLERYTLEWLEAGDRAAREHWKAQLDAKLEARFAALHERVPEVAEAHFSLAAEYARLWLRGTQWLSDPDPDAEVRMLRERLLPEALWDAPIQELATRVEWGLDEHQRQVRDQWQLDLAAHLEDARIPNPPPAAAAATAMEIDHGHRLHAALDVDMERFDQRTGLAATAAAGTGLATPLIARALQARLAARATQAGVAHSLGRAGQAGALGAGLCTWSGPFALGCGLAAAGATIVGTDWLLLRLDAARHRDDLEQALHEALDALETETRAALRQAIAARAEARHAASRASLERSFQPWTANPEP
ncbi:hypothetical protein [Thioalkalivibrio sp. ALJT]|uniref:hypothetical protein n=1 Tax=Thioalkalivibrio sp. ALJT TaxID=1158146 RepID=UPI000371EE4A|nr:hypothetical protein [Thioalkalivibrio sp. ALJT]